MSKHKIGDRLGFYDLETGQYVTYRALTRKPSVSFSKRVHRVWRNLNRPREFLFTPGKGLRAVFLLVLLGLGGLFIADQVLKTPFPVYATPPESHPGQVIWSDNTPGNTDAWNCRMATWNATVGGITLNSNTTHTALCITKAKIDMSTVSGRELFISFDWYLSSNPGTYPLDFGWFFTLNNTIPNEIGDVDPRIDVEISMVRFSTDLGGGSYFTRLYIQRKEGQAISSLDFGETSNCRSSGTLYICGSSTTFPANSGIGRVGNTLLNFTGNPNDIGHNSQVNDNNVRTNQDDLNWFQFATVPYYLGFFERPRSPDPIGFTFVTPSVANVLMPATPQPPPQNIDTGGFFGPIIRALIQIGVIALAYIAQFLGFVADAFVTAMDAVGGFFRLGAIGTAIRDALVGVGTWVANVFGTIFGQAVNIATAISNTLTAAMQIAGTYWTQLTSWVSSLKDLLSLLWPFIAFFGIGLPFSALLTYWLIQGIIMSYNTRDGALQWMRWTWILSATLFNIMWAIGERAFDVILNVKRLLAQWL